jgi:indolepyruvate decarboxylase
LTFPAAATLRTNTAEASPVPKKSTAMYHNAKGRRKDIVRATHRPTSEGRLMTLTEYLFHRLRELGVEHTFGIPGDFVLPVYAVQQEVGMPTVVCAHEPGVGFAADAYARFRGLGVALVTYGPGALNTLNPVACAYAEQSPLLVVSGGPEVALRRPDLNLHHVIKDFESQLRIYREVTVDAAILDDAASASETIDRVLRNVVTSKRPGYLEIPRDRVRVPVAEPPGPLRVAPDARESEAAAEAIDEAVGEIVSMLQGASRPVLYVGVGIRRHGLTGTVVKLAERLGVPVVTDLLGKAAFPESHAQFAGVYLGALGDPGVRSLLDESDCVLGIGVVATDLGTGFWTQRIHPKARVMIDADRVEVRYHRYDSLPIVDMVAALLERAPHVGGRTPRAFEAARVADSPEAMQESTAGERTGVLRVSQIIEVLRRLDQSRYSFVTDVGDSWFIGLELRTDVFVAAGFYSSMGFAVPAALGAGLAEPSRRPFVIVGDGAFQMTGTELATHVDLGLRPIVLLLNNGGYGMLEAVDRPRRYFDRRGWDYPGVARSLGAEAERVNGPEELTTALKRADAAAGAYLIEAFTSRDDLSPIMTRLRSHVHSAFSIRTQG